MLSFTIMARTKEFKEKQALEKALNLFWEKGYRNTSLKELLKEMNILNGSFYNSFGNKKNVFLKVLKEYDDYYKAEREQLFNNGKTFSENIRFFFNESIVRQEIESPKGCFLANSISKDILDDQEISQLISQRVSELEVFFKHQIELAIERGELDSSTKADELAAILLAYLHGLMRLCVLNIPNKEFSTQTNLLLDSLGI